MLDKLWRTVVGLIVMHPILIAIAGKRFIIDLIAEYQVAFSDLKRMWRK